MSFSLTIKAVSYRFDNRNSLTLVSVGSQVSSSDIEMRKKKLHMISGYLCNITLLFEVSLLRRSILYFHYISVHFSSIIQGF